MRRFRLSCASSGAATPKINATVAALQFFFKVTLDRPDLTIFITRREVATPQCRSLSRRCSTSHAGARSQSPAKPHSRRPNSLRNAPTRSNPPSKSVARPHLSRPRASRNPTVPSIYCLLPAPLLHPRCSNPHRARRKSLHTFSITAVSSVEVFKRRPPAPDQRPRTAGI